MDAMDLFEKNKQLIKDLYRKNADLIIERSLESSDKITITDIKESIEEREDILFFPKNTPFITLLKDNYELVDSSYLIDMSFFRHHDKTWNYECRTNINDHQGEIKFKACSPPNFTEWCDALHGSGLLKFHFHFAERDAFFALDKLFVAYKPKEMKLEKK